MSRLSSRVVAMLTTVALLAACAQTADPDVDGAQSPGQGAGPEGGGPSPAASSGAGQPSAPGSEAVPLVLTVPQQDTEGATVQSLDVHSDWPVTVDVAALDGGSVTVGRDAWGRATLRFPRYSASESPPRAIIRVTQREAGGGDPLSPGRADFTFGADFAVDATSQGTVVDGGNNLIQRGLASDAAQIKIDVDDTRPMCRVQGSEGLVELVLTQQVTPEVWYRARCTRTGDVVRFTVVEWDGSSGREFETVAAETPTGDLQWAAGTPLSVGGKLAAGGAVIRSATDQFTGSVADPFLVIDRLESAVGGGHG